VRKRLERGLRALNAYRKARDAGKLPVLESRNNRANSCPIRRPKRFGFPEDRNSKMTVFRHFQLFGKSTRT
jgi:hypothetical protein